MCSSDLTGADITVSDEDGVGIVSIGSKDGAAVNEARRRIGLILDPPTAELGATYDGRVVNITKFGAFVNILPGRDGLVHISKLGRGKRIDRVEDVLSLGDEVTVRVDDIDQNGKLSLSLVGEDGEVEAPAADSAGERTERPSRERAPRESRDSREPRGETASFEAFWDEQARDEFGDLGPGEEPAPAPAGGRDRGGDRRGGARGRGGRGRGGPRRS